MGSLLNQMDVLVAEDREKKELWNTFFASVSTAEISPEGNALRPSYPYSWLNSEEFFILSRHLVLLLSVGLSSACHIVDHVGFSQ